MKPAKLAIGFISALFYAVVECSPNVAANAMGYANVILKPGFNLISIPLASSRDSITEIFDPELYSSNFPQD
jgi:hypothetical protein